MGFTYLAVHLYMNSIPSVLQVTVCVYTMCLALQVARVFGQSKELNATVMKRLREKSRGSGIVAL